MLGWLSTVALASGTVALEPAAVVIRDRIASRLAYAGAWLGPRLDLRAERGRWRPEATVRLAAGYLQPVGVGGRRFASSSEDVLTGETRTSVLRAPWSAGGLEASGALLAGQRVQIGPALRARVQVASGLGMALWGLPELELGVRARVAVGDASAFVAVPLASVVTRLPWSVNPLRPDRSVVGSFLRTGTRVAGPWTHAALSAGVQAPLGGWAVGGALDATLDTVPGPLVATRLAAFVGRTW